MESKKKNCSSTKHSDTAAISFCLVCKLYLCNKCQKIHSELYENHQIYDLNANLKEIFTGYCQEENHNFELNYYCKSHNELCCAACLCKIKDEKNGQHKDCEVFQISQIKDEKKNKLNENIKILEELSNNLFKSINEIKILFNTLNEKKEKLKLSIQ